MSGEYIDFYIDPDTLDYVYDENTGTFKMVEDTRVAARQRIYTRLSAWMGEWIYNTEYGVDYKNSVIKQGVTKAELDTIFLDTIYEEDLVESIDNYSSEIDTQERTYTFSAKVLVSIDDIVNEVSILPTDEWEYTYSENTITATCVTEYIETSNKLYVYVNTTLPLSKQWSIQWN